MSCHIEKTPVAMNDEVDCELDFAGGMHLALLLPVTLVLVAKRLWRAYAT